MRPGASIAIILAAAATSCADGPHVEARYAPEFTPKPGKIAILGAFQGGRMSSDAWIPIGPRIGSALGHTTCEAAFGEKLKRADQELYEKIDAEVAENGITDEMLDRLAPKTDADLIMTVTVLGRSQRAVTPSAASQDPTMPGYRPGAAGGNVARGRSTRGKTMEWRGTEIHASLFSVKLHRSVGKITLRFGGSNFDAGIGVFAAKLGAELPGSTCAAWAWDAK